MVKIKKIDLFKKQKREKTELNNFKHEDRKTTFKSVSFFTFYQLLT